MLAESNLSQERNTLTTLKKCNVLKKVYENENKFAVILSKEKNNPKSFSNITESDNLDKIEAANRNSFVNELSTQFESSFKQNKPTKKETISRATEIPFLCVRMLLFSSLLINK